MARATDDKDLLKKEYAPLNFLMDGRISFKATMPTEIKAAETNEIGVTARLVAAPGRWPARPEGSPGP